jgi:serine/threonine protein phosphatase PrpC
MEDAHVVSPLVPGWPVKGATALTACLTHTALSCFAVLDGHGGAAVSRWCAQHLVSRLQAAAGFERGSRGLEAALAEAIHALDQVRLSQAAALGS